MLHQPHPAVTRPALFVVVAHNVLVVGVGVLREVALDELAGLAVAPLIEVDDAQLLDIARALGVARDELLNDLGGLVFERALIVVVERAR